MSFRYLQSTAQKSSYLYIKKGLIFNNSSISFSSASLPLVFSWVRLRRRVCLRFVQEKREKIFAASSHLRSHVMLFHLSSPKPMYDATQGSYHYAHHTGEKQHTCEGCSRFFPRRTNLTTYHFLIHIGVQFGKKMKKIILFYLIYSQHYLLRRKWLVCLSKIIKQNEETNESDADYWAISLKFTW